MLENEIFFFLNEEEPLKKSNSICYRIGCYPEKEDVHKELFERAESKKGMKVVWLISFRLKDARIF